MTGVLVVNAQARRPDPLGAMPELTHSAINLMSRIETMNKKRAPAIFISHGSPMLAIEPGLLGAELKQVGQRLDGVRGIVMVSPHWQTQGLFVGSHPKPLTVHDFGGFPKVLNTLSYPAQGSPDLAERVRQALQVAGISAQLDADQGLDHGVWVPLMHLRPEADIPVVPLSLPENATPEQVLAMGKALAPLREEGVVIIGSGSMTHNLFEFRGPSVTQTEPYVTAFVDWVRSAIARHDTESLLNYRTQAPHAVRAHPSDEHFLPLFVALGAAHSLEIVGVLEKEVRYGMLSMESYIWASPPA